MAGDWHARAFRLRAPQRIERCIGMGQAWLCMGLILVFDWCPTPRRDIADNRLAAGVDVNMLDTHGLTAAAPQLGKRFSLQREGPQQLHSQIAVRFNRFQKFVTARAP